jgi:DNA-binding transcriptional LysR family regulator
MDRLEAMSLLLQAAEAGSFSKASRDLRLPLATVSRKISELEAHLKASLLTRSQRGLVPTPAGRSFIDAAKTILELLSEAERAAAGEYTAPRGDLVVTAPIMFGRLHVVPVVTSFLSAYPDVAVGLVLTDRVAHFFEDHVDVALRIGALPDSSLTATRLGSVRRVVCASPAYIARYGCPATPDELVDHAAISFESVSAPGVWTFQSGGVELSAPLRSRLSVNTIDAAIDAALSGAGLARAMSYQIVEFVRQGKLAVLLEAFEPSPSPVHLVYHGQPRLPLKLRAFVDFVAPRLRQRLTEADLACGQAA